VPSQWLRVAALLGLAAGTACAPGAAPCDVPPPGAGSGDCFYRCCVSVSGGCRQCLQCPGAPSCCAKKAAPPSK